MKFKGKEVTFESTGRQCYCYGTEFSPNDPGSVCYGSDGGIWNLSPEEIQEVANYMIDRWLRWAKGEVLEEDRIDVAI